MPLYELDGILLRLEAAGKTVAEMATEARRIASSDYWVSEGAYVGHVEILFQQADVIIWLDIPWWVASYRIISRHIKAEMSRNNRFPGWRRLYYFWRWSGRYYDNKNHPGLNIVGVPNTRQTLVSILEPYEYKLRVCRNAREIETLLYQKFGIFNK